MSDVKVVNPEGDPKEAKGPVLTSQDGKVLDVKIDGVRDASRQGSIIWSEGGLGLGGEDEASGLGWRCPYGDAPGKKRAF